MPQLRRRKVMPSHICLNDTDLLLMASQDHNALNQVGNLLVSYDCQSPYELNLPLVRDALLNVRSTASTRAS
jgi:hypothetical protein